MKEILCQKCKRTPTETQLGLWYVKHKVPLEVNGYPQWPILGYFKQSLHEIDETMDELICAYCRIEEMKEDKNSDNISSDDYMEIIS